MERNHMRKTSGETRFELNAILSTFKYSRAIFLNRKQQQQVLAGRSPEQAFFPYNQDAGFKEFDSGTASEIPSVHELFAGFIGPYQYSIPHNAQVCGTEMSGTEQRLPSQAPSQERSLTSLTPDRQPVLHEDCNKAINIEAENSWGSSNQSESLPEITDMDEMETVLVERDEF